MITTDKCKNWLQLIGIVGCAVWLTSCKQSADTQTPVGNYETMKVSTTDKALTTTYSATIRGRQDIDIYPQVSGTIQELCVAEGSCFRLYPENGRKQFPNCPSRVGSS